MPNGNEKGRVERACASYLPPKFVGRLFETVNPSPYLKPTWNLAPTDERPASNVNGTSMSSNGPRAVFHEGFRDGPQADSTHKRLRSPACSSLHLRNAEASCRPPPITSGFDGKVPFAVTRKDGDPVAFAGI
jgi:hypothetical protein